MEVIKVTQRQPQSNLQLRHQLAAYPQQVAAVVIVMITRSGKPKSVYSFIAFCLINWYKRSVNLFLIVTSSRFQKYHLFLTMTKFGISRQKVSAGINFEQLFMIEDVTGNGSNSIPLPTFP